MIMWYVLFGIGVLLAVLSLGAALLPFVVKLVGFAVSLTKKDKWLERCFVFLVLALLIEVGLHELANWQLYRETLTWPDDWFWSESLSWLAYATQLTASMIILTTIFATIKFALNQAKQGER